MLEYWICPSILSANWAELGTAITIALNAGADRIHIDAMDHHYVPALTLGPKLCSDLRASGIQAPIDVHLMVKPVDDLIQAFAQASANCISIHPETTPDITKSLALIHSYHCEAGLVLNPHEPVSLIQPYLNQIQRILIMSVNPGRAGQAFIPEVLEKVRQCRHIIDRDGLDVRLEIDGGINQHTIALAAQAGIDTFVVGSYIFDVAHPEKQIQILRERLALFLC